MLLILLMLCSPSLVDNERAWVSEHTEGAPRMGSTGGRTPADSGKSGPDPSVFTTHRVWPPESSCRQLEGQGRVGGRHGPQEQREQARARDDEAPPSSSFATTTIIVVPLCSRPHSPGAAARICSHRSNPWNPAGLLWSPARQLQQRCMVGRNGNDGGTWPWMMGSAAAAFPDEMID